jgi:thiol-disulfide isomerase/thioredoxin
VSDLGTPDDAPRGPTGDAPADAPAPAPRPRSFRLWATLGLLVVVLAGVALALTASGGGDAGDAASPTATATVDVAVTIDGPPEDKLLAQGEPIPDWTAPGLDGGTVVWSERAVGPAILAIWAPWCPHCQAELPRLAEAVEAHPGVSLITIATAVDPETGPSPAEYMASEGLTFPVGLDDEQNTLAAGLGVQGFPTTYFVDAEGLVVAAAAGELEPEAVDQILAFLEGA